jgi:autoinducer 2-degrading protein
MQVTVVSVRVRPEHVQDFIEATRHNHEASVCEAGNRRFDVLQLESDPTCFILYEAWASESAARAHKTTAHYARWRAEVEPWMAEPRSGTRYRGLLPDGN